MSAVVVVFLEWHVLLRTLWFVSEHLRAPLGGRAGEGRFFFFSSARKAWCLIPLSEACPWGGFIGEQEWQEFMGLLLLPGVLPLAGVGGSHGSREFIILWDHLLVSHLYHLYENKQKLQAEPIVPRNTERRLASIS